MNEMMSPVDGEQIVDAVANTEAGKPDAIGATEDILVTVMPIADIKIGTRHRKDMGDIAGLARSIADVGLLHPIVIRPDGTLIAGERRLAAFRQLERTEIPVTVVDLAEIVSGEFAENAHRKNFTPTEIDAIRRALEPIEKQAAKERMSEGGKGAKVSQPSRTTDRIGALAGVSGRTVEKIAEVVAAAEAEPKKFGHLVEEMDKTGKVDRAHQQLKIDRQREANAARGGRATTPSKPKKKGIPGWARHVGQSTPEAAPDLHRKDRTAGDCRCGNR
jgi:ParB/RepB/Spo0J family partition protein